MTPMSPGQRRAGGFRDRHVRERVGFGSASDERISLCDAIGSLGRCKSPRLRAWRRRRSHEKHNVPHCEKLSGVRIRNSRKSGPLPRAGAAAGRVWVLWTQHACRWAKPLAWRGLQDGLGRGSKPGRRCACIRPPSQPSPCPGEGAFPACRRVDDLSRCHLFLRQQRAPTGVCKPTAPAPNAPSTSASRRVGGVT